MSKPRYTFGYYRESTGGDWVIWRNDRLKDERDLYCWAYSHRQAIDTVRELRQEVREAALRQETA